MENDRSFSIRLGAVPPLLLQRFHQSCPCPHKDECISASALLQPFRVTALAATSLAFQVPYSLAIFLNLGASSKPVRSMPPLFGIAYFIEKNFYFTPLTPSCDGTYVSACSNFRPVHSEVRQFASVRAFSPYPVFQPRDISVGIPFLFKMALAFVLSNLPVLHTSCSVKHDARRSIGGMVSGYMVPSFPSSVVKLRLLSVISCFSHCLVLIAELVVLLPLA
jgi:hypothetical protein